MNTTNLTRQLGGDEGRRSKVYKDSLGYDTIGIGRLIDTRKTGGGLRGSEMDLMLSNDIEDRVMALSKLLPWMLWLSEARQGVLLNMSFQLGVDGLLGFKNTLQMVKDGDYEGAARGMLQSKWATQTPARAKRLSEQMRANVWQYAPGT